MAYLAWLAVVFLIPSAAPTEDASNLLPNPGLELDENHDGRPDGWSFAWEFTHSNDKQRGVRKQPPQFLWDDTTAHSGQRSLFIANQRPQDDGVWTLDGVPLPPDARFLKLQAWIKTREIKGTQALVSAVFQGEGRKYLGADYSAIAVNADRDWTRYTACLAPPPGTLTLRIRLWLNMGYSGTGAVWYDHLTLTAVDRCETPIQRYEDDRSLPELTARQKESGYVAYARHYLRLIFPTSVPDQAEIGRPLACFAAPGEREPLALAVRAWRDLKGLSVTCTPLTAEGGAAIGGERVSVRPVRYGKKQGQSRWGMFHSDVMEVPLYLASRERIDLAADRSQAFWITVHVPDAAPPGRYRGTVSVSAHGLAPTRLPIEVEVLPVTLREPKHVYFGMYHRPVGDDAFRAAAWRDMREHGMTSVGLCCNLGAKLELDGDRVRVTFDGSGDLERAVNEYRAAGFTMPIAWLMGSDVLRWCRQRAGGEEARFSACYRQIIEAIIMHGNRRQWPEIIFQPLDEPFEHASQMDDTETCLRILKSIPGVRTEEDGPNGRPENLERVYALCDVLVYHDGPTLRRGEYDAEGWRAFLDRTRKDGKEIWFYNIDLTGWHPEVLRFGYGFGLYQAGGTGMIQWSYQTALRPERPQQVYDKLDTIIYQYPPAGDETGGPTLAWEAAREGVDDYRYLCTLERLVEETSARGGPRAARAQTLWSAVRERLSAIDFRGSTGSAAQGDWTGRTELAPEGDKIVSGDHKMANGLRFEDYDALRRQIADAIVELEK